MTYEYACLVCGHQWEVEQKITDNPIEKCEKCGEKAKRLVSGGVGFQLKGGGWASEGYK